MQLRLSSSNSIIINITIIIIYYISVRSFGSNSTMVKNGLKSMEIQTTQSSFCRTFLAHWIQFLTSRLRMVRMRMVRMPIETWKKLLTFGHNIFYKSEKLRWIAFPGKIYLMFCCCFWIKWQVLFFNQIRPITVTISLEKFLIILTLFLTTKLLIIIQEYSNNIIVIIIHVII